MSHSTFYNMQYYYSENKRIYLFSYNKLETKDERALGEIFRFSFNSYNRFLNMIFSYTVNISVAKPGNPIKV